MENNWNMEYELKEAAKLLGMPLATLQTKTKRGVVPYKIVQKGLSKKKVITSETLQGLLPKTPTNVGCYETLKSQLFKEMAAGTISKRPCSEKYIQDIDYFLAKFWSTLDEKPTIERINADNFRKVLIEIGIDFEKKKDYYSTKMFIFKGLMLFTKLLIREGYKKNDDITSLKELKPSRAFKLQTRDFPDEKRIRELIDFSESYYNGRSKIERFGTNVLIHLYAYAGLRKIEAANLMLEDIDFGENSIRTWGKGGKRRKIPMVSELRDCLHEWLSEYRPYSKEHLNVLLSTKKLPLTESSINCRFERLSKKFGHRIMPHRLRHSCATILSTKGMPPVLIQMMLGHSNLKTTEIYLNATQRDLFKWFEEKSSAQSEPQESKSEPQIEEKDVLYF